MSSQEWSDEELMDYFIYHSETDLHLFCRVHVLRLAALAGRKVEGTLPALCAVDRWLAADLVKAAKARLAAQAAPPPPAGEQGVP